MSKRELWVWAFLHAAGICACLLVVVYSEPSILRWDFLLLGFVLILHMMETYKYPED